MRHVLRLLALAPLLIPIHEAGAQAGASEADEVKSTLNAMWAAVERGDSAGYAAFVHPNFTQFGENDVYLTAGKDLEVRSMAAYFRRAKEVHTDMHHAEVMVRGSVAWITYYWTDAGTANGARFTSRGKSTRIFVKENGRWLCIHGHYTAVP